MKEKSKSTAQSRAIQELSVTRLAGVLQQVGLSPIVLDGSEESLARLKNLTLTGQRGMRSAIKPVSGEKGTQMTATKQRTKSTAAQEESDVQGEEDAS